MLEKMWLNAAIYGRVLPARKRRARAVSTDGQLIREHTWEESFDVATQWLSSIWRAFSSLAVPRECCRAALLSGLRQGWKHEQRLLELCSTAAIQAVPVLAALSLSDFGCWALWHWIRLQQGASSSVDSNCDTSGLESGLVLTHRSMARVWGSEFWRLTVSSSVQLALLLETSCCQFCGRCVILDWLFYSVFCLQMACGLLHSLPVFGPLGRYCPDAPLQNQKFYCQRGLAALIFFFIRPHVLLCKLLSTKPVSTLI